MIRMATECNDWCEHLACQYFSTAVAIEMCQAVLVFLMLSAELFHLLAILPNHRLAPL